MNISLPDISMMIDASLDGWCGVLLPRKAIGVCSPDVLHISMNWTELMTVVYLQKFRSTLRGKTVRVLSDNATAVCCLKRQGSLKSAKLHSLTTSILEFCETNRITLVPEHLRGVMNVLADQGSSLNQCGRMDSGPNFVHSISGLIYGALDRFLRKPVQCAARDVVNRFRTIKRQVATLSASTGISGVHSSSSLP